jgi:hypothetical protein
MVQVKPTTETWVWDFPDVLPENLAALARRSPANQTTHDDNNDRDTMTRKTGTGS